MQKEGKRKRGVRRAAGLAVSALVLLAALALNVLLAFCAETFHFHIDLTEESLYTMSEDFENELAQIKDKVTITFCADPDVLLAEETTRVVYYMAVAMSLRFDNIEVKTVDARRDPGALQPYKSTSASQIGSDYLIIETKQGFRIRSADSFWTMDEDGTSRWSYNGEYEMATVILSLVSINMPTVCVTYGHGEASPEEAEQMLFYRLIPEKLNARVRFIDLDREEIPEDCVLLIINGATKDYAADVTTYPGYVEGVDQPDAYLDYRSPTEKIDRYLDRFGALMVQKDPFVSLPVLEALLADWGIAFVDLAVSERLENGAQRDTLVATYASEEEHALGNSFYTDLAALATAPPAVLHRPGALKTTWESGYMNFSSACSALYSPVLLSSEKAQGYNQNGELASRDGDYHLVSVVNRSCLDGDTGNMQYSYVLVSATTALTDDERLSNNAYANKEIIFATLRTMTATRVYSAMDFSINSDSYGGKILRSNALSEESKTVYLYGEKDANGKTLSKDCAAMTPTLQKTYTVLITAVPAVLILAAGVGVCLRRRHL